MKKATNNEDRILIQDLLKDVEGWISKYQNEADSYTATIELLMQNWEGIANCENLCITNFTSYYDILLSNMYGKIATTNRRA